LSEIPGAWKSAIVKWRSLNRRHKVEVHGVLAPDANEEYLLYQTMLGAWPFETDTSARESFRQRLGAYMTKALREAKVHTSWLSPNEEYERAVQRFVDAVLDPRRSGPFLQAFAPLQARVAEVGSYNSLAQLVVKITAPGVPDFYQGTELWDLNLVDPDNRRSVDYSRRRSLLAGLKPGATTTELPGTATSPEALLSHRADGRLKLFTMHRALAVRTQLRDAFEQGSYIPLQTTGTRRDHVFAFGRRAGNALAITCVPRLVAALAPEGGAPLGAAVWTDTRIELPSCVGRAVFRDAFTNEVVDSQAAPSGRSVAAADVFRRFPVSLLVADEFRMVN
jgi:(1->4)-alpha-D-glucan 1-alpha-D-glucosylmutase